MGTKKMHNNFDAYFKKKLFDYEVSPPGDVFNKIEDTLERNNRHRWFNITLAMAASIAIIIATGVGYLVGTHTVNNTMPETTFAKAKTDTQINSSQVRISNLNNENYKNTSSNTGNGISSTHVGFVQISNNSGITSSSPLQVVNYVKDDVKSLTSRKSNTLTKMASKTISGIRNYVKGQRLAFSTYATELLLGLNTPQNDSENEESTHNWQLGGSVAPLYSYRNFSGKEMPPSNLNTTNISSEKALLAYAGGLNINYEKSRWRFETGVYYSRQGQEMNDVVAVPLANTIAANDKGSKDPNYIENQMPTVEISNSMGVVNSVSKSRSEYAVFNNSNNKIANDLPQNTTTTENVKLKQEYQYIEVPFIANYKFVDRKLEMSISGGLSTNIMVGNNIYMNRNNKIENIGEAADVNVFNYSGIVGLAMEMPIASSVSVRIEPRFRYHLNSINKNADLNSHPYSFGIFSGLAVRF